MKKILTCLILAIILTNCEIKPKEAKAERNYYNNYDNIYSYKEEEKSGMVYGIWYVKEMSSQTGYSTTVVNLTKDALEIELLKKQLSQK